MDKAYRSIHNRKNHLLSPLLESGSVEWIGAKTVNKFVA